MIDIVYFVEANVGSESTRITYVFHNKHKMDEFLNMMKRQETPFNYSIRTERNVINEDPFERYCGKAENCS